MSCNAATENIIEKVLSYYPNGPLRSWLRLKSKIGQMPEDMFVPFLQDWQPTSILEIGCGYGFLSNCLSLQYPNATVLGVDSNGQRIAKAQLSIQGRKNISFSHRDALTMLDQQWDYIILVDVIHHVPRPSQEKLVATCRRLLKPGGRLLIREVDPDAPIKFFFTHIWELLFYFEVCKMLTIPQLTDFMKSAGFASVAVQRDTPKSIFFPYVTYLAS